jgi:two-component system chemotaxis response regulator CheB
MLDPLRPRDMMAVPDPAGEPDRDAPTGITCPDCGGAIVARGGDLKRLTFRCRIGHLFNLEEMIAAKEDRAEGLIWRAVSAIEELAALLRDTGVDPERARRLQAESAALREIVERMDPACIEGP